MTLLALDSSSRAASCAILRDGALLGETYLDCGLTHSQTLLSALESLCRASGVAPDSFDRVAVSKGPGSFTGLRIGMAAAKAIAAALDAPLAGVSTLEALGYNLLGFEGVCCAVLDARRNQVYAALFSLRAGRCERLCADEALSLEALAGRLGRTEGPVFLAGDGAKLCLESLGDGGGRLRLAPPHLLLQRASGVGFAAMAAGAFAEAAALAPAYLRLSQAERERAEREGRQTARL